MHRHLLAASLVLLLSTVPLSARPTDFDLVADCAIGLAGGDWDLPIGDQPGTVRGIMADAAGRELVLEGTLTPVRTVDGIVRGRLQGALYPMMKNKPHPKAIAMVTGTWVAGPLGRGRFHATIVEIAKNNGNDANAVAAAGKLAGMFSDMQSVTLAPTVGRFACRWTICR